MRKLIILLCAFTTLFACSKSDDDDNSNAITKENIAGTYKITSIKVANQEVLGTLEECQQDDLVILNTNNTVEFKDVGVECDPPGNGTGTWDLNGNTITLEGESATIKSYDRTNLVVEGTQSYNGVEVTATITFTRQ
jgi:hypothetical protein